MAKIITCPDCDHTFVAETADGGLQTMYPHYMAEHKEIISTATEEKKKAWMANYYAAWEVAPAA